MTLGLQTLIKYNVDVSFGFFLAKFGFLIYHKTTDKSKKVTVTLDKIDGEAIINIKDEGKGIPHEIIPKIFRAYFTTKENGNGIGLNLSKKTIDIAKTFFDGVIITDDLDMGAIKDNFTLKEIVVNAINAGDDILLFSNYTDNISVKEIHKLIKDGIKNGDIKADRIKESYEKIIKLKMLL